MLRPCLIAVLFACSVPSIAQHSIRQVDFKNFTYPLSGPLLGHSNLQWLGSEARMNPKPPIRLRDGMDVEGAKTVIVNGEKRLEFESGFTFESVSYGDLTGDGQEEAIVDLKYHTGGTQTTDYVYIFTLEAGKTRLLAYCHTGSRSSSGLYKVYADNGNLDFELFDPRVSVGDCCSNGVVITRFVWKDTQFYISGSVRRKTTPAR